MCRYEPCHMKSTKVSIPIHFISWVSSFSDISRKCIFPNMIRVGTALIIFGKMHFLLISENEFFSWNKSWRNYKFSWNSHDAIVDIADNAVWRSLIALDESWSSSPAINGQWPTQRTLEGFCSLLDRVRAAILLLALRELPLLVWHLLLMDWTHHLALLCLYDF